MKSNNELRFMKGFSMCRNIFVILLVAGGLVFAAEDENDKSRLEKLEKKVANVIAKAGINFGGEFRSQFLLSRVKGDGVEKTRRTDENTEYTSVDFDISARPNTALQGRCLFRMYADWRNFFNSLKSPIMARWISIDGLVKNVFGYHVGDYKQKYSPLTLYSPDIDIEYEPEIFSRMRKMVMEEEFLGNNEREFQGLNFNFDAEIVPVFKEFHFNILGARLRTAKAGASFMNMLDAPMDKFIFGENLDMVFIPDFMIGESFLVIFDSRYTFGGEDDTTALKIADTRQQKTKVFAGRGGIGTAPFVDEEIFNLKIKGELAFSFDDSGYYKEDDEEMENLQKKTTKGMALKIDLLGNVALGSAGNLNIDFGWLKNDLDFKNELAQSPTLFAGRIMNIENDLDKDANLYSPFDAMYRHVFKFTPSYAMDSLDQIPQRKIAYTNSILTQKEMSKAIKDSLIDDRLFLVMPFGPATPNRSGIDVGIGADFLDRAILLSGGLKLLNEVEMVDKWSKAKFVEIGFGASVDIAGFGSWWPYPFVFSGGYKLSTAERDKSKKRPSVKTSTSFLNLGLYWTFWKKASLLGGLQHIQLVRDRKGKTRYDQAQSHLAIGLEYKIMEAIALTGSFGSINVKHATIEGMTKPERLDFKQLQTDLYLTVHF